MKIDFNNIELETLHKIFAIALSQINHFISLSHYLGFPEIGKAYSNRLRPIHALFDRIELCKIINTKHREPEKKAGKSLLSLLVTRCGCSKIQEVRRNVEVFKIRLFRPCVAAPPDMMPDHLEEPEDRIFRYDGKDESGMRVFREIISD